MINLYFVSGLGANKKAFEHIQLPTNYKALHIAWKQPLKNETLSNYAQRMVREIDTSTAFVLLGLSFGGILVQEMTQFVQPLKTIVLSSVCSPEELNLPLQILKKTNLHKKFPWDSFKNDTPFSDFYFKKIFGGDAFRLKDFFTFRDPYYLEWSIHQIAHWEKNYTVPNCYRIHGQIDAVFPIKYLQKNEAIPYFEIPRGSHLMVLTKAKQVSDHLAKILSV